MIPAQIKRFAGVGLLATLAHLIVALATKQFLGLPAQHANIAGFCAAFGLSYMGHARFTFRVSGNHAVHMQRFLVTSLAGLLISATLTYFVHDLLGAPFVVAMAAVGLGVPVFTYLSGKFWTFAAITGPNHGAGRWAALACGATYFAVLQSRLINHDTAWYLVATRKWLDGARLYVDLVEVNPPLNFYYTAPAIWLADGLGLSDIQGQTLLTSAFITGSLAWVWAVLTHAQLSEGRKWALLAGTAFAVTVPFLQDYSQREHLLAIVLMPWLLAHALGHQRGEIARALFAGVGLCLKPHFMLIAIALTVVKCAQHRSARPIVSASNLVFLVMGLTYVGAVKVLHPEYLDTIVPMATQVYGAYGFSAAQVLQVAAPAVLLSFLLVAMFARKDPTMGVITAVAAALVAIYAAQWTGYGYQIAPAFSVIAVGCFWALTCPELRMPVRAMAGLCLGLISWNAAQTGIYRSPATAVFQPYLEATGPAPKLAVFSSSLWPSFPLALKTGANWTSRYPALWLIPGALNRLQSPECAQGCARVELVLANTREHIVTDFIRGGADMLIIDQNPFYIDDPAFDYVDFLSQDPRFASQFAEYHRVADTHGFTVYRRVE